MSLLELHCLIPNTQLLFFKNYIILFNNGAQQISSDSFKFRILYRKKTSEFCQSKKFLHTLCCNNAWQLINEQTVKITSNYNELSNLLLNKLREKIENNYGLLGKCRKVQNLSLDKQEQFEHKTHTLCSSQQTNANTQLFHDRM